MNEQCSIWRKTWSWIVFLFQATFGGALLVSLYIGVKLTGMSQFWSDCITGGLALTLLGAALWLYAPSVVGNYEIRQRREVFWEIAMGFGMVVLVAGPMYTAMYAEFKRAWADNNATEIGLYISYVVMLGAYILGLVLPLNSTLLKWSQKSKTNCWAFFMGIVILQAPLIADMLDSLGDPQNWTNGTSMIALVILNAFVLLMLHTSTQDIAPSKALARHRTGGQARRKP